jgi:hypothetical protein
MKLVSSVFPSICGNVESTVSFQMSCSLLGRVESMQIFVLQTHTYCNDFKSLVVFDR